MFTLAGCAHIGQTDDRHDLLVGSAPDAQSQLLAQIYAGALRSSGAHVSVAASSPNYLEDLADGRISLVGALTGTLLRLYDPTSTATTAADVYTALSAALPDGLVLGDYAPAQDTQVVVAPASATQSVAQVDVAAAARATIDDVANGRAPAALATAADPAAADSRVTVLRDDAKKPTFIARNVVPLYQKSALTRQEMLAVNRVAGELSTADLATMRQQAASGQDAAGIVGPWLGAHGF